MRLSQLLPALSLAGLVLGCGELPDPPGPATADAPKAFDFPIRKLPAYETAAEKLKAAKGDEYDDIRFAQPESYAITQPPQLTNWRHMREWEPMQAMMLTVTGWPASDAGMQKFYADMVKWSSEVAEVWVVYDNDQVKTIMEDAFDKAGADMDKLTWFNLPNDSVWAIDYGPLPIVDEDTQKVAFVDFKYYHQRPNDDSVPTQLAKALGATVYRYQISTEGGNFQGDGDQNCYISTRGLQLAAIPQEALEAGHKAYMNCQKVTYLWDITDDGTGHIDMFFKQFAYDGTVMGQYPEDTTDTKNAQRMDDNVALLEALPLKDDKVMTVHRIPMPGWQQNAPHTYINSTIINGYNLWPMYSYPEWKSSAQAALAAWKEAMPGYKHIGIISDDAALASGAIHCVTRTIPQMEIAPLIPAGTCVDGTCQPPAGFETVGMAEACADDAQCFGPAWKCTCNDCDSTCEAPAPTPDQCDGLTYEGCCDGDTLTWCEGKQIRTQDCPADSCGWDDGSGFYNCQTDGQAEPNGDFPMACGGGACEPNCADKACGDDGCGGSCGECGEGTECNSSGKCLAPAPTCKDECGGIGEKGCDGATPWSCSTSADTGCYVKVMADACGSGQTCSDGACDGGAATGGGGATGGDTETGATTGGSTAGGEADATTGGGSGGKGGGGSCTVSPVSGGHAELYLVGLALLGLAVIRRRAIS